MKDTNIGIRSLLYFNSWKSDKDKSGKEAAYAKLAEEFSDHLQQSLVTKKRPEELLESVQPSNILYQTNYQYDRDMAKEYIGLQIVYLSNFEELSLNLKSAVGDKS